MHIYSTGDMLVLYFECEAIETVPFCRAEKKHTSSWSHVILFEYAGVEPQAGKDWKFERSPSERE